MSFASSCDSQPTSCVGCSIACSLFFSVTNFCVEVFSIRYVHSAPSGNVSLTNPSVIFVITCLSFRLWYCPAWRKSGILHQLHAGLGLCLQTNHRTRTVLVVYSCCHLYSRLFLLFWLSPPVWLRVLEVSGKFH